MVALKQVVAAWEKASSAFYPAFAAYCRLYQQVVQREIVMAGINSEDHVLHIGCGAIPFTAVQVAKQTGARVTGLDQDASAVKRARKSLRRFGLDHDIDLEVARGETWCQKGYSVVMVALQVDDKEKVYAHLQNTMPSGTRLIFRRPSPSFHGKYDALPVSAVPEAVTQQSMKAFDASCLYVVSPDE